MANCNDLFRSFNQKIRLSDNDRNTLISEREKLRSQIALEFYNVQDRITDADSVNFFSQGSYVMDTIIKPLKDDFDLDDGIYFSGDLDADQRHEPKDYSDWIYQTLKDYQPVSRLETKDTCIRVKFKDFHVDLPIYYFQDHKDNPDLAHLKEGWILSNPIKFISWFEEKAESSFEGKFLLEKAYSNDFQTWQEDIRKNDVQLRRIVRYLKAWGDFQRADMPPGIILTILAAENYVPNERDDISLNETLVKIEKQLISNNWKCLRPTPPENEDLFKGYKKLEFFKTALSSFVRDSSQAISNPDSRASCLKWQTHLGDRFDCSIAERGIEGAVTYGQEATIKSDNDKSA